ncbi:hypothetical protein HHI36_009641 [Cryptolaemus montrouzieri]|uniref:Mutator-like transposase domain-containing protein n=1 Tax=Cryptolaemus montrouzieri TaxID=559131 RepID=A0ABD2MGC8_9CUCU
MEVVYVKIMFLRSKELYGVTYGNHFGDGDSKTFIAILRIPTVMNWQLSEVNAQKRMGIRLRNVKKTKKLSGKGKLKEALVKKLSSIMAYRFEEI